MRAIADTWSDLDAQIRRGILLALVARVDLLPERLDIQVRMQALAHLDHDDLTNCSNADKPVATFSIPARLKRTGMEMRMLVDGERGKAGKSKPDRSLVRLIVKARIYHEVVLGNRDRTMKDLVDEAGVTRSYFTRAMRLAYLAPDIVRSIVDGTQPPGLTAAKLTAASRLPLEWSEQRSLLGFN